MQHWVFDLDGTLVDSMGVYFNELREIHDHFGIPFLDEHLDLSRFHKPSDYFKLVLGEPRADLAYLILEEIAARDLETIQVFPQIESALQHLQASDRHLAVWTGRELRSAMTILEATGLKKYFSMFVGGQCVPRNKPAPDGLEKILKKWNSKHDQTYMIGDHEHDMMGARDVGVSGISVAWPGQTHPTGAAAKMSLRHFECTNSFYDWTKQETLKTSLLR